MIVGPHATKPPQPWDTESDQLGLPAVLPENFPLWSRSQLEQLLAFAAVPSLQSRVLAACEMYEPKLLEVLEVFMFRPLYVPYPSILRHSYLGGRLAWGIQFRTQSVRISRLCVCHPPSLGVCLLPPIISRRGLVISN